MLFPFLEVKLHGNKTEIVAFANHLAFALPYRAFSQGFQRAPTGKTCGTTCMFLI